MAKYRVLTLAFVIFIGVYGMSSRIAPDSQSATPLPPFPTSTPSPRPATLESFPTSTPVAPPTATARPDVSGEPVVELTCWAEGRWGFLVDVRRGPGSNWGIQRQIVHNQDNLLLRVFGQDTEGRWYHVVMPEPYEDTVGWVWQDSINLFGVCDDLPITDAEPEITIEAVPDAPNNVPMPAFAADIQLTQYDRAFLLKPGIVYIRRERTEPKPIQAHVLVMDLNAEAFEAGVTVGAEPDLRAVPISQMATEANAFAAITGDFYGGNYMPQNMTIIDGQVVSAPKFRATFAITEDNEPFIGYFTQGWTWPASVVAANGEVIPLQLMNLPCQDVWLCLYSHHLDNRLPVRANLYDGIRVLMDAEYNVLEIVNNQPLEIPEGHFVLRGGGATGQWLLDNVNIGDQLTMNLLTEPDWRNYEYAIGGGPRIVIDGEFWQDCDPEVENPICEEFDERFRNTHYFDNSIPRAAVGFGQGRLMAVMVEGYEVVDSAGMTQRELADLFIEFGAVEAMEFDGGGSATMWVDGFSINDFGYEGERPLSNALLFFWNE